LDTQAKRKRKRDKKQKKITDRKETRVDMKSRIFILIMIIGILAVGCDAQTDAREMSETVTSTQEEEMASIEQTVLPTMAPVKIQTAEPKPTEMLIIEPVVTAAPAEKPSVVQTPAVDTMPKPTPKPTVKPTPKPTLEPTPEPTPAPTPEPIPEPEAEITAVSSSFINSVMAEINRRRQANGVEPAALVGSISSSCKSHAIEMAESGSPFHASNPGGCEAVGRVSDAMPGSTVGSTAVTHVGQLATADVTKIGIGAVYCNGYLYFVVRGTP
jgi:hypothetical protein